LLVPRAAMVTPWSTNAVEITHGNFRNHQNWGVSLCSNTSEDFDPMLSQKYLS
jgi:hypothetical protein